MSSASATTTAKAVAPAAKDGAGTALIAGLAAGSAGVVGGLAAACTFVRGRAANRRKRTTSRKRIRG